MFGTKKFAKGKAAAANSRTKIGTDHLVDPLTQSSTRPVRGQAPSGARLALFGSGSSDSSQSNTGEDVEHDSTTGEHGDQTTDVDSATIEVRSNSLPISNHLYIVYTDSKGEEYYLRGGPSGNDGGSATSGSEDGNEEDYGPGKYGYIKTEYGAYGEGTVDWAQGAPSDTVMEGSGASGKYGSLKSEMDKIESAKVRYKLLGPNSNTVVFAALKNVGISPSAPTGAVGKNAKLEY